MKSKSLVCSAVVLPLFLTGLSGWAIGGISGGGGNIIAQGRPTVLASAEHAEDLVRTGSQQLEKYLQAKVAVRANLALLDDPLNQLFNKNSQGQNIFDILANSRVDIRDSSPCLDSAGNPVDGSSVMAPNSICLSSMRIAAKVDADEIPEQAAALMMHEFSERLGFDDGFAVEVQKQVLRDFERSESK